VIGCAAAFCPLAAKLAWLVHREHSGPLAGWRGFDILFVAAVGRATEGSQRLLNGSMGASFRTSSAMPLSHRSCKSAACFSLVHFRCHVCHLDGLSQGQQEWEEAESVRPHVSGLIILTFFMELKNGWNTSNAVKVLSVLATKRPRYQCCKPLVRAGPRGVIPRKHFDGGISRQNVKTVSATVCNDGWIAQACRRSAVRASR